jgi:hypothetical protein
MVDKKIRYRCQASEWPPGMASSRAETRAAMPCWNWPRPGVGAPHMLAFVARQIGVDPAVCADYAQRDQTRREHAVDLQRYLGLRFGLVDRRTCLRVGTGAACATDRGEPIVRAGRRRCASGRGFQWQRRQGRISGANPDPSRQRQPLLLDQRHNRDTRSRSRSHIRMLDRVPVRPRIRSMPELKLPRLSNEWAT